MMILNVDFILITNAQIHSNAYLWPPESIPYIVCFNSYCSLFACGFPSNSHELVLSGYLEMLFGSSSFGYTSFSIGHGHIMAFMHSVSLLFFHLLSLYNGNINHISKKNDGSMQVVILCGLFICVSAQCYFVE